MPSCMACFADATMTEHRGSLGGLLAFIFNVCLFGLAVSLGNLAPTARVQAFAVWLSLSLIALLLLVRKPRESERSKNPRLLSILHERRLALYLMPWIMFCLVNSLEAPILNRFFGPDFFAYVPVAELAIGSLSALIGGLFADRMGRKLIAIIGFALLGLGYAVLGLFPETRMSWFLYVAVDGIAWGMFVVIFFIVVWGDLAGTLIKEKYYLIGGLPFLLSWFVQLVIEPYVEQISIYTAFSLASFLLFLAVIPLMFAPETLPEKNIQQRELRKYADSAKKLKESHTSQ